MTKPKVMNMRLKIEEYPFREWERMLLWDLAPRTVMEAHALIPSLKK